MSGYELLPLLPVLNQLPLELHIFCDWQQYPWHHTHNQQTYDRVLYAQDYLCKEIGVDTCILPPLYELQSTDTKTLQLFSHYLIKQVLPYSFVGKLGLLSPIFDTQTCQTYLENFLAESSELPQKGTSRSLRTKHLPLRNTLLETCGTKDWILRKVVKHDLQYFRDADVDTLIPMDRSFLFYETVMKSKINLKRTRFHGKAAITDSIIQLTNTKNQDTVCPENIYIYASADPQQILSKKKRELLLTKGGQRELHKLVL